MLVQESLKPLGMSNCRLAKEVGVPTQRIGEIPAGKRTITADTDPRRSYRKMSDDPTPSDARSHGRVVSVRGSVVDVRFESDLPPIYTVLRAIVIEVLAQLDARHVRGIALTPTQGLARGHAGDGHGRAAASAGRQGCALAMFDVFGNALTANRRLTDVQWRSVHRLRRRWHDDRPNPKSSKRGSRSSMCWCRWNGAARRDCSAVRAWARPCC
jgi:hypothetical protein